MAAAPRTCGCSPARPTASAANAMRSASGGPDAPGAGRRGARLHLRSNVPAADAPAVVLAELYQPWPTAGTFDELAGEEDVEDVGAAHAGSEGVGHDVAGVGEVGLVAQAGHVSHLVQDRG